MSSFLSLGNCTEVKMFINLHVVCECDLECRNLTQTRVTISERT